MINHGTDPHCDPNDLDWVNIDLTPLLFCNYHCPYCYNGFTREQPFYMDKSVMWDDHHVDILLHQFSEMKYKLMIQILGGEPLFWKPLNRFLEGLYKLDNVRVPRIYTNAYKKLDGIPLNPKLEVILDYHPMCTKNDTLLYNAKYCRDHDIKFLIKIMMYQTPEAKHNIEKFVKEVTDLGFRDKLRTAYINNSQILMDPNYFDLGDIPSMVTYHINGKEIDEKDLWKTNLSFTGQKCHLNYLAIRPAGEICQACLGINTHSNIFEDMDFGKNYRIPDVHCWVGYCGANCCTELIKVDEKEGDENG